MMARACLILTGFTAVAAQVVLMRELMVACYGNELSLGITLAAWLLWTAFGSGVLGRAIRSVPALEVGVAVALPLTVVAVRSARGLLGAAPGEMLGPPAALAIAVVSLSVFCSLSGCLFAAGSRLLALGGPLAGATSRGYLLEAIGSGLGGLLAAMVLLPHFGSIAIALLVAWLNIVMAAFLGLPKRAAWLALPLAALIPVGAARIEAFSLARLWQGFHLLAAENSLYGNLAVVAGEGSTSVYENGLPLFNVPDPPAAEEAVHYALLQHPAPRSLLLIGGGLNGSIPQALQHPTLARVDYVELDPAIPALAARWLPGAWAAVNRDPRVHVEHGDARLLLDRTSSRYDVIVLNLPDPQTALLNRFYTVEFFRLAAARLNPGGVLSFRLTASENYISPELADLLGCVYGTLREVFPHVTVMTGAEAHFFASTAPLLRDANGYIARLRERRLATSYVREYYLPFRLAPDRALDLTGRHLPVNRDFQPIAYYQGLALWSTRFGWRLGQVARIGFLPVAVVGLFGLFARGRPRAGAGLAVAAMGFTAIALEILLLLAFQAIHGYVFQQLALLTAGFMGGSALGSYFAISRRGPPLRTLQLLAALGPLAFYGIFELLARHPAPLAWVVLALAAGGLAGCQFPVASRIFFGAEKDRSAGALYALDLVGACAAALIFSTWLVPVFGFFRAAVFTALLNLPALWACPRTPAR